MARLLYTVDNIVEEIRAQVDEQNRDAVSTESDILPTINRAQDYAFDILTRKYPEPILRYTTLQLIGGQSEYSMPEDVFEDRVQKLEVIIPNQTTVTTNQFMYQPMDRIDYTDVGLYESTNTTNIPLYYCIFSRKIRIVPAPTGQYSCRMWYLRDPEKLVMPQGRITVLNSVSNYVIVDSSGDSLTTEADQLGSYVNVIDGQTGEVKGTLQIQSLAENKITFRTTPTRSNVLNRTVSGSLPADLALDDYISPVDGTCVPYYGRPISNFIIQYAVSEIVRKLGGAADTEENILQKFEKQVERTWAGRQTSLRIKKKSVAWKQPQRRWFWG